MNPSAFEFQTDMVLTAKVDCSKRPMTRNKFDKHYDELYKIGSILSMLKDKFISFLMKNTKMLMSN
ncbi:unnamed protein product [Ceratitis capitata]|uniref:(Mediterranean fruit fly) hypothetical protein n=1 Tax=Ceratitis capitata TaxID=7213 RepID=A0A811URK3_CERCA|nr:unnamed protein product [Ceratitis capitata]